MASEKGNGNGNGNGNGKGNGNGNGNGGRKRVVDLDALVELGELPAWFKECLITVPRDQWPIREEKRRQDIRDSKEAKKAKQATLYQNYDENHFIKTTTKIIK